MRHVEGLIAREIGTVTENGRLVIKSGEDVLEKKLRHFGPFGKGRFHAC
ncbi:hypothetical protein [Listeria aquatica]